MSNEETRRFWPVPTAVCLALIIFAATFFAYADKARVHEAAGVYPALIGLVLFASVMAWLTDILLPEERKRRVGVLLLVVFVETAVFFYLLGFLILNLYGS